METEIWKDIPGYEGIYKISNIWDQVYSYGTRLKPRMLKIYFWIYKKVSLCKKWIRKECNIHRLKAITFIENPLNNPCINHIDWNKYNNDLSNLEWCTHRENMLHADINGLWNNGRWKYWKDHNVAKPIAQYSLDWEFIKEWWSISDAIRSLWPADIYHAYDHDNKTAWWFKWRSINNKIYENNN